jgi:hypothetical protein
VAVEKGTTEAISTNSSAYGEQTITYERLSLLKFPEKSFLTPTPVCPNYLPN